jgi:hypothetical protein
VRSGAEVIIQSKSEPIAVLLEPLAAQSPNVSPGPRYEEETAEAPVLDLDFVEDVEKVIADRKPWNPSSWD